MISNERKQEVLSRISEIENFIVNNDKEIAIGALCRNITAESAELTMDNTDPLKFCKEYLNINASSSAADKNPKYRLLRELTNGFLEYRRCITFLRKSKQSDSGAREWISRN